MWLGNMPDYMKIINRTEVIKYGNKSTNNLK
nr:MAG TPA: hypothetical protein [Bacteriophage sp.]